MHMVNNVISILFRGVHWEFGSWIAEGFGI